MLGNIFYYFLITVITISEKNKLIGGEFCIKKQHILIIKFHIVYWVNND